MGKEWEIYICVQRGRFTPLLKLVTTWIWSQRGDLKLDRVPQSWPHFPLKRLPSLSSLGGSFWKDLAFFWKWKLTENWYEFELLTFQFFVENSRFPIFCDSFSANFIANAVLWNMAPSFGAGFPLSAEGIAGALNQFDQHRSHKKDGVQRAPVRFVKLSRNFEFRNLCVHS